MKPASALVALSASVCLFSIALTSSASDVKLVGSGASFPFPIYSKWFKDFSQQNGARVDYQAKGSGAGIQDFINGTVDFAASDAAMEDAEMSQVKQGVVLLPMTAGEIVLSYNLPGVGELRLPRAVYPEIFSGAITRWNDPKLAAANPGVQLPDQAITVVVRSDSSGTTFVFTGHLAAVNADFKSKIGQGKSPQWPKSDKFVKAPKNDGITATIKQTPGAVGYIEYGYAKLTKAPTALLENKAGKFIAPGPESGAAALATAKFPSGALASGAPNLIAWLDDPEAEKAYPIATFTWLLLYKDQDDQKAKVLRDLVEYCLTEGQKSAESLGYIPLPENVVAKVRSAAQLVQ